MRVTVGGGLPVAEDQPAGGGPENPADNLRTISSSECGAEQTGLRTLPKTIGRYRIIRILGEGGMGTVFEAEQDLPRRNVALKVIRSTWASPQTLRRFELESQALGRLHHPGIAQIYEAGSADTGSGLQPFFAMELIHGTPLTLYAAEHTLDIRGRLKLMAQVCDAVQHAHQRGIIHRDLKPGNILVDEMRQPKILDFGLARATDCDAEATRQTDTGQLLGTLAYMSPEQVLADPMALDMRSDVYSLGVILYELLTYKLPYTLSRQIHEAVRVIQESDPAPLSSVNRVYRGDIETIVSKALEKDKNRRYASAADLAGDIRRYLDDQPIAAKPASVGYQLEKFARRHKALAIGVAATFLALVLGVVASTVEALRARRAEHEAQQETEIAKAVSDFLQKDLLAQASAYSQSKPDPNMKVRTAVDRAAQNIGGKFAKQPEVEAAVRETIGRTYVGLGMYAEARQQLLSALELERKIRGPEDPKTIETMVALADANEALGKFADAEALAKQALEVSRRTLGPEHLVTLGVMNRLVSIDDELGKYNEGVALAEQAVEISRRVTGPESKETAGALYFLAIMYFEQGKFTDSEKVGNQAVEIRRRLYGPDNPETLNAMNNLAAAYGESGQYALAETLNKQIVESRRRVLGPEHPDTLDSMVNLAFDYRSEKRFTEAEKIDRSVLDIQRRVLGPEHPLTLRSMENLADDVRPQGDKIQAETLDSQALEVQRRVLEPDNPDTLKALSHLAIDYRDEGKYQQAAALDEKTVEALVRSQGPHNPYTSQSWDDLATDYKLLKDYPKAEAAYRKAYDAMPDNPDAANKLAWFLLMTPEQQMRRPQEALEIARKAVKLAGDNAGLAYNTLGLALVRNDLWEEAVTTLNKSVELNKEAEPTDFFLLAVAYRKQGGQADAERNFTRGAELARKKERKDADTVELWKEAARALGKPVPSVVPESERTASY
jgi:eukaryotic-like serine/threonine-protein kinase